MLLQIWSFPEVSSLGNIQNRLKISSKYNRKIYYSKAVIIAGWYCVIK